MGPRRNLESCAIGAGSDIDFDAGSFPEISFYALTERSRAAEGDRVRERSSPGGVQYPKHSTFVPKRARERGAECCRRLKSTNRSRARS